MPAPCPVFLAGGALKSQAIGGGEGGDTCPFDQLCSPCCKPIAPMRSLFCLSGARSWASRLASPCHCPFSAVASETPLRRPLGSAHPLFCRATTDMGARTVVLRTVAAKEKPAERFGWALALARQHEWRELAESQRNARHIPDKTHQNTLRAAWDSTRSCRAVPPVATPQLCRTAALRGALLQGPETTNPPKRACAITARCESARQEIGSGCPMGARRALRPISARRCHPCR